MQAGCWPDGSRRSVFRRKLVSSTAWELVVVPGLLGRGTTWRLIHFVARPLGATLAEQTRNILRLHLEFGTPLKGEEPVVGRVSEHAVPTSLKGLRKCLAFA
jgi:hypothetical protein